MVPPWILFIRMQTLKTSSVPVQVHAGIEDISSLKASAVGLSLSQLHSQQRNTFSPRRSAMAKAKQTTQKVARAQLMRQQAQIELGRA
ncbi:hypothetical protein E2562_020605 [Oryza meyeriana var. granulata]|uniref:Uncharacterized protein n=1 Tax=Oryza meyeriana var. granulata TaxID=110450 RepID=A0A6G1E0L8_9ORYZ|nr:hypothetical protein E2562_020605 [Oryza meyeriana var. granulata]